MCTPTEFLIPNCINSSLLPPNYSPLSANYVAQTLEDSTMKHTAQDILNYVEDNDVKFVRLAFCDIFGNQKNISVFAGDLP